MTLKPLHRFATSLFLLTAMTAAAEAGDPALYEVGGERLIIGRYDFGVASADKAPLAFFAPSRGEIVTLTPESPTKYSYPDGSVTLDGERVAWRRGTETLHGNRSRAIRHETVHFGSLEGRLTLPAGRGRHPVLVMTHGSGRASRDFAYYGLFAAHLAGYGLGVLTWDKRADWRTASVRDLAGDAMAAIDYLKTRKDIDRARIGVFGHSQGGWIAPLVATQRGAAFVCVIAAPAVSTAEQELDEAASDLKKRGFGEDIVREAQGALREMFRVIETGEGTAELTALVERVRGKPWGKLIDLTASPEDLAHLKRAAFDPRPSLESLRVPVLALFGGADQIVPPARNVPLWKQYAGGAALEIEIYAGANHGLYVGQRTQYADGVVERLTNWLLAKARLPSRFAPRS